MCELPPRAECQLLGAEQLNEIHTSAPMRNKAALNRAALDPLPVRCQAEKPMPTIRLPQSWFARTSSLTSQARRGLTGSTVTAE